MNSMITPHEHDASRCRSPSCTGAPAKRGGIASRVVNLSESGALFGPTELTPGTSVEVILSPPMQVGSLPTGKQVCSAEVVRATEVGAVAARFESAASSWRAGCNLRQRRALAIRAIVYIGLHGDARSPPRLSRSSWTALAAQRALPRRRHARACPRGLSRERPRTRRSGARPVARLARRPGGRVEQPLPRCRVAFDLAESVGPYLAIVDRDAAGEPYRFLDMGALIATRAFGETIPRSSRLVLDSLPYIASLLYAHSEYQTVLSLRLKAALNGIAPAGTPRYFIRGRTTPASSFSRYRSQRRPRRRGRRRRRGSGDSPRRRAPGVEGRRIQDDRAPARTEKPWNIVKRAPGVRLQAAVFSTLARERDELQVGVEAEPLDPDEADARRWRRASSWPRQPRVLLLLPSNSTLRAPSSDRPNRKTRGS